MVSKNASAHSTRRYSDATKVTRDVIIVSVATRGQILLMFDPRKPLVYIEPRFTFIVVHLVSGKTM